MTNISRRSALLSALLSPMIPATAKAVTSTTDKPPAYHEFRPRPAMRFEPGMLPIDKHGNQYPALYYLVMNGRAFLDGKDAGWNVRVADEIGGYIVRYVLGEDGEPVIDGDEYVTEIVYGFVHVKRTSG